MIDPGFARYITGLTHGVMPEIIEQGKGLVGGIFLKMPLNQYFYGHCDLQSVLNLNPLTLDYKA